MNAVSFKHNLGDKVKDVISGLAGIVTSRSETLYGCNRYWVQPQQHKDGKVEGGGWFDEDQVVIVEAGAIVRKFYGDKLLDACIPAGDDPSAANHHGRLWSLWEIMNHFKAKELLKRIVEFTTAEDAARARATTTPPNVDLPELRTLFLRALDGACDIASAAGFADAVRVLQRQAKIVKSDTHPASLAAAAATCRWSLIDEFEKRHFLYVSEDRVKCLENDFLFEDEVYEAFPSARLDILEAGNCLAAECCTAAVFHAMRASEVALRALAVDRGVQYPNSTVYSKQVGDLIVALDAKIKKLRDTPATAWHSVEIRDAQLKFYAEAIVQFRGFNEAWRKHMAHAHEGAFYDRDAAMSIINHVKGLMMVLASKVTETTTTPEFWPSA